MNLLITGGTGFLGRNLILSALKNSAYEKIFLPVRNLSKLHKNFEIDQIDINHPKIVAFEGSHQNWNLPKNTTFHHVIHSAGVIFARTKKQYMEINSGGVLQLFRELNEDANVVVISSQSAGGPSPKGVLKRVETMEDRPINIYGQSKHQMETEVRSTYSERNVIFFRPPMILGPRDQATLPLFKMMKSFVRIKPGVTENYYSFIHVDDLVKACMSALEQNEKWKTQNIKHYHLCSTRMFTGTEFMKIAAKASCRPHGLLVRIPYFVLWIASLLIYMTSFLREKIPSLDLLRANELAQKSWALDPTFFMNTFQWNTEYTLEQSLKQTHDWYQSQGMI